MRLHRFYVSQPLGEEVVIEDVSTIKQWKSVFRYASGGFVIMFNGNGNDYKYSINNISSSFCTLTKISSSPCYTSTKKVTLYLSIIKKDNFELVVQKATELGVTAIVPIISSRSEKKNLNEERLQKITIEASEQCGRGDIPIIFPIISLSQALESISSQEISVVLQMNGMSWNDTSLQENIKKSSNTNLFIGPEGGWSPEEEAIFSDKEITTVSLGNTVLRTETAAIVSCAFVCL